MRTESACQGIPRQALLFVANVLEFPEPILLIAIEGNTPTHKPEDESPQSAIPSTVAGEVCPQTKAFEWNTNLLKEECQKSICTEYGENRRPCNESPNVYDNIEEQEDEGGHA